MSVRPDDDARAQHGFSPWRRPLVLASVLLAAGAVAGPAAAASNAFQVSPANSLEIDANTADTTGAAVTGLGDVNGDGRPDFAVGSQGNGTGSNSGLVYVVFGRVGVGQVNLGAFGTAGNREGYRIDGPAPNANAYFVARAGDVNHDGLADLLIGAPGLDGGNGGAYVVFGQRLTGIGSTIKLATIGTAGDKHGYAMRNGPAGSNTGSAVAGLGDVNGDGISDAALGAPGLGGLNRNGEVIVVFGQRKTGTGSTMDLSTIGTGADVNGYLITDSANNESLGTSLAAIGDVSGDGRPDVLVGAPGDGLGHGGAYVVYGQTSTGATSEIDVTQLATQPAQKGYALVGDLGDGAGRSVANAGDVNGDGRTDFLIGATSAPLGTSTGRVYLVFSGEPPTTPRQIQLADIGTAGNLRGYRMDGPTIGNATGLSVAGLGDVNGDGVPDAAIGDGGATVGGVSEKGLVYVVFGRRVSGLGGTLALSSIGAPGNTQGYSLSGTRDFAGFARLQNQLAGPGDIDGDGRPDVLVGSYGLDGAGVDSRTGGAFLVHGSPLPDVRPGTPRGLKQTSLTLAGTASANGFATSAHFEVGVTAKYTKLGPSVNVGAGTSPVALALTLTGLRPATAYHYRVVATNAYGTTRSPDRIVATLRHSIHLTTAKLRRGARWQGSQFVGRFELRGTASGKTAIRFTLGRFKFSATVNAGKFAIFPKIPRNILPGRLTLRVTGSAGGVAITPTSARITIPRAANGVVRLAWLTAIRNGTPTVQIQGFHPVIYAYFVFASSPARARATFAAVWIGPGGRRFTPTIKRYARRLEFSRSDTRGLAFGTWRIQLRSRGAVVATARIRIVR